MVMLTYIARTGREMPLSSESDCATAIRAGELHRESLIMDGRTGRWMKAGEHGDLSGLLARVRVTGPTRPGALALKAATVTAWLLALIGPPAIAWALGADPLAILPRSAAYTIALGALSAIAGFFARTGRRRWRLALALGIMAIAAGIAVVAKTTGALT